jgi:uncharacterized membrane protein YedE/YeeE
MFDQFISPLIGGVMIGLSASLFLFLNGKIAGISGLFWNSIFNKNILSILFILGLPIGVFIIHSATGKAIPPSSPSILSAAIGGLIVGLGVKLANGCTSGHGICGIARLSMRSIVATLTFMGTGIITVALLRVLL